MRAGYNERQSRLLQSESVVRAQHGCSQETPDSALAPELGARLTMNRFVTLMAVAVACVWLQPLAAIADDVPQFDVRKSCHADVQAYPGGGGSATCLTDEQKARDVLVAQWTQFAPDSRTRCTKMVNDIAGTQSYVELLSCLQDAKDVKTLPKN